MRPLKLHTKTTLLASATTLAVLAVVLALISVRVARHVREEQKALAELQATNLAEHINQMPSPRDPEALARVASLVHGTSPDAITVRIWARVGGVFVVVAASDESEPVAEIPEETRTALRSGLASKNVTVRPAGADDSLYRVFAPVTEEGRLSGAVEVIERLDDAPSIAWRYEQSAFWMALVAVALITLGIFLLFRQLVYRPLARLLEAMARAKAGDLRAEANAGAADEMGILSREFNSMIARLREMTEEREAHKAVLEQRVREATGELAERNAQLEEANIALWRTSRRATELERLAAAGQTASQFAHEVGTPLNLISGHVQLLLARASPDPSLARTRLQTISAQIERIERIVRRMLDRTRPEAIEMSPLDVNALLQRIFDATAPTLDAKGVRLTATLSPELPLIDGDADRLQQVFINLINNALDAMPGGGELQVSTSLAASMADGDEGERSAARVVVDFADTGCGMTSEVCGRIFDPLYTTKGRGRGTGLGLVVVRQVLGEHGGRIEVESEPQEGSHFRLIFPVTARQHEAAGLAVEA